MSPERKEQERVSNRKSQRKTLAAMTPDQRKEYNRKRRINVTPEANRNYRMKKEYSLTPEQWDQMFADQGSCCAICKSDDPKYKFGWHTDHCHGGSGVRGILCHGCNIGLGGFKDNVSLLQAAMYYLANHAFS